MQSTVRLEKVMECLSELMLTEKIKAPTHYSEAYLSGRDLTPLETVSTSQRSHSSRENTIADPLEALLQPKIKRKQPVVKTKEPIKEQRSVSKPVLDWSEHINKDVKSMKDGCKKNPLSDAYLINMTPKVLNMFVSQKFMAPLKNIRHSISRSGMDKAIEEEAVNSEELKLSIRCAVGKVIKSKISKLDNIPEQLKQDIDVVFN